MNEAPAEKGKEDERSDRFMKLTDGQRTGSCLQEPVLFCRIMIIQPF